MPHLNLLRRALRLCLLAGLIALGLGAAPVSGQIRLGFRVMPQLNGMLNADDNDIANTTVRLSTAGLSVGASVGYQFSPKYGFEINVLYGSQGQEYERRVPAVGSNQIADVLNLDGLNSGGLYTETVNVTAIKVPVLFTYSLAKNPKAIYKFAFGPQVSIISLGDIVRDYPNNPLKPLDENGNRSGTAPAVDYGPFEDPSTPFERLKGIEYALVAGAGMDFRIAETLYLNAQVRFEYGLTDIENKDAVWIPPSQTAGQNTVRYYDNYYGPGRARTARTTQFVFGFMLGVTYHLNSNKDPGRYNW